MDSINQNQLEHNVDDLRGLDAVRKIQELVDHTSICFFCTANGTGPSRGARPMGVQRVDEAGNLWFLSSDDSHKNKELSANPAVSLFFQNATRADFLQLDGHATITKDPAAIRELWKPLAKTWFTGGVDDPRITVIKVMPTEGYYWDTKHGMAVAGVKMMIGAIIGRTLDDSIEGKVTP